MRIDSPQPPLANRLAETISLFLMAAILAAITPASVHAANPAPGFIKFSVQDLESNFIPIGEVEFCLNNVTATDNCLYADIERGVTSAEMEDAYRVAREEGIHRFDER